MNRMPKMVFCQNINSVSTIAIVSSVCALSTKSDLKWAYAKSNARPNSNIIGISAIKHTHGENKMNECESVYTISHTFDKLSGDKMLGEVSAVSHISSR